MEGSEIRRSEVKETSMLDFMSHTARWKCGQEAGLSCFEAMTHLVYYMPERNSVSSFQ